MKKLLLTLGTLASIAAPVAAVVACGSTPTTTQLEANKAKLLKTKDLTADQKAKIKAAKTTDELNTVALSITRANLAKGTFEDKKALLKAFIDTLNIDPAQKASYRDEVNGLVDTTDAGTVSTTTTTPTGVVLDLKGSPLKNAPDPIQTFFDKITGKTTTGTPATVVDPDSIKKAAENAINALTNIDEAAKKAFISRIHNVINFNSGDDIQPAVDTVVNEAKAADVKATAPKTQAPAVGTSAAGIVAADHATQATALQLDGKVRDDSVAATKSVTGDFWITFANVDFSLANDNDGTGNYFAIAPATTPSTLKIAKADLEQFKISAENVFAYYEGLTKPLDKVELSEAIANAGINKAISDKFGWSSGASHTSQVNKDKKAEFETRVKTVKTKADIADLLADISAFVAEKDAPKTAPAVAKVDWGQKAQEEYDKADAIYEQYDKLFLLQREVGSVTDEASYNSFVAKIAAAKK